MKRFNNITEDELLWLARNIYFEARSESLHGRFGVAFVTLNRATWKGKYPDTIKGVVTQRKQFSWFNGGFVPEINEAKAWSEALGLAKIGVDLYNSMADSAGFDVDGIVKGAQFYFADYIKPPPWAAKMIFTCKIGKHLFYKL
jgi:spore germination cell wall hydrolase CwlJ-like protein